jgi:hypothetical protein
VDGQVFDQVELRKFAYLSAQGMFPRVKNGISALKKQRKEELIVVSNPELKENADAANDFVHS